MGLSVNGSATSGLALRQVERATGNLNSTLQKLSSLQRINTAADDAAGLAISEGFRSQVRQLNAESSSIQSGINLAQVAEGGLTAQGDALGRVRELALQAANGTVSPEQRQALNAEAQQLVQGIDQTAQNTEFNGVRPLNGPSSSITLDAAGSISVQVQPSTATSLGVNGIDLSTQAGASAALSSLDTAAKSVAQGRASLGAQQSEFQSAIDARDLAAQNAQEADSRVRDLDVTRAAVEQSRNQILQELGIAAVAQTNNVNRQLASRLLGA